MAGNRYRLHPQVRHERRHGLDAPACASPTSADDAAGGHRQRRLRHPSLQRKVLLPLLPEPHRGLRPMAREPQAQEPQAQSASPRGKALLAQALLQARPWPCFWSMHAWLSSRVLQVRQRWVLARPPREQLQQPVQLRRQARLLPPAQSGSWPRLRPGFAGLSFSPPSWWRLFWWRVFWQARDRVQVPGEIREGNPRS